MVTLMVVISWFGVVTHLSFPSLNNREIQVPCSEVDPRGRQAGRGQREDVTWGRPADVTELTAEGGARSS